MQTIYDLTLKQMQEMLEAHGQKAYRAKQIFSWLYRKRVSSFDEMSDLPKSFIEQLKQEYSIEPLKEIQRQVSHDGTIKFPIDSTTLLNSPSKEKIKRSTLITPNHHCGYM